MKKRKEKKKRTVRSTIYDIITVILICVIAVCAFKIGKIIYTYYEARKAYDAISDIAGIKAEDFSPEKNINWKDLKKKNPDIKAWIFSKGTIINYPVVQTDNNVFYLRHLFNKDYHINGTPFIDAYCESPFDQFNTIIYGHNMNDGSMFESLLNYTRKNGYYKKHKSLLLLTPNQNYKMKVISAATIKEDDPLYKLAFNSDEEKANYINQIQTVNSIPGMTQFTVDVLPSDKIVMLSTCAYLDESRRDQRGIVWCKLVPAKSKSKK